jgi:hypothetical protein
MSVVTRTLAAAPSSFRDERTKEPAFGAYAGPLPAVDLGRLGLRDRLARRKRWVYAAISTEELWLSFAIVRTGYVATAFAFAYDLIGRRMLVDGTVLGPPPVACVSDDLHASGELARFALGATRLALRRGASGLEVHVRMRDLELDAVIDETAGPPAITAIARLGDGLLDATEKRALLPVSGRARCGSRAIDLAGGRAGYDYTHGLLPRHTTWRWAFAMGKAASGEPIGFNLVRGFVGEAECAAFVGGEVFPMAEPAFELDLAEPLRPWRLVGSGIDLAFAPGAMHAETKNLFFLKSRFVQPVGTFSGTLRVNGRDVTVAGLPGVVEDQDVLW